jgi:cytidine deaminase
VTSISDERLDEMVAAAREVRAKAYAPYSGFHVGAALLAGDRVFTAVNIENASYPLSVCAERNAVAMAVAAGETSLRAVAVVTDATSTPTPPCGGCRQVLREFGEGIAVIAENADGSERKYWSVAELLPDAFGPDDLGRP